MSKDIIAQCLILLDTVINGHPKSREHDTDEPGVCQLRIRHRDRLLPNLTLQYLFPQCM